MRLTHHLTAVQMDLAKTGIEKYWGSLQLFRFFPHQNELENEELHTQVPTYGKAFLIGIFHNHPPATLEEFGARLRQAIQEYSETENRLGYAFLRHKDKMGFFQQLSTPREMRSAVLCRRLYDGFARLGLSQKNQNESAKLFTRFIPAWISQPETKIGPFIVSPGFSAHPEATFALNIWTDSNELVCTIGGHLIRKNKEIQMHVTNLQSGKGFGREQRIQEFEQLVKKPFRTFLLQQLAKSASKKGKNLFGHEPLRFFLARSPISDEAEYARQIKRYNQAYAEAGFKPLGKNKWTKSITIRKKKNQKRK